MHQLLQHTELIPRRTPFLRKPLSSSLLLLSNGSGLRQADASALLWCSQSLAGSLSHTSSGPSLSLSAGTTIVTTGCVFVCILSRLTCLTFTRTTFRPETRPFPSLMILHAYTNVLGQRTGSTPTSVTLSTQNPPRRPSRSQPTPTTSTFSVVAVARAVLLRS